MELTTSEKLKTIMKRHDVTMSELADRLGQTRQNVSNKFTRDNFTENDLKLISEALDINYRIEFDEQGE